MKEFVVSFEEKHQHNLVLTYFKTNLLNIIFDDFSIWLLGNRTEFSFLYLPLSFLYIPQGHKFISTEWLWSTVEYVK